MCKGAPSRYGPGCLTTGSEKKEPDARVRACARGCAAPPRRPGSVTQGWRTGWRRRPPPGCSMLSWKSRWACGDGGAAAPFQGHLDPRAGREVRRHDVNRRRRGPRTRAEKGRHRPLATKFGQVTVSRIADPGARGAERAPAGRRAEPAGGEAFARAAQARRGRGGTRLARGPAAAVTRATGVKIGKRQAEELVLRAACDVDGFCGIRCPDPAPDDHVLVLTFDGKGIVMRPYVPPLPPRTAAAAEGKSTLPVTRGKSTAANGWPSRPASTTRSPSRARRRTSSARPRSRGERRRRRPRSRKARGSRGSRSKRQVADGLGHQRHPRRHRRGLRRGGTP